MTATGLRSGGCLCGRIRYTVPAQPLASSICHCRDCQKQAGSAFSVLAVFPRDQLVVSGALAEFAGTSEAGTWVSRKFCASCGSPILSDTAAMQARGLVAIKAGTLDETADLRPVRQYWARSKQAWLELAGDAMTCLERG